MSYQVFLTDHAMTDVEELDDYLMEHDSLEKADYVLGKIEEAIQSLADMPERGSYPSELAELGIKEYRELFFKPYRVIGKKAYVYLVADGRREMETLLNRRLLYSTQCQQHQHSAWSNITQQEGADKTTAQKGEHGDDVVVLGFACCQSQGGDAVMDTSST